RDPDRDLLHVDRRLGKAQVRLGVDLAFPGLRCHVGERVLAHVLVRGGVDRGGRQEVGDLNRRLGRVQLQPTGPGALRGPAVGPLEDILGLDVDVVRSVLVPTGLEGLQERTTSRLDRRLATVNVGVVVALDVLGDAVNLLVTLDLLRHLLDLRVLVADPLDFLGGVAVNRLDPAHVEVGAGLVEHFLERLAGSRKLAPRLLEGREVHKGYSSLRFLNERIRSASSTEMGLSSTEAVEPSARTLMRSSWSPTRPSSICVSLERPFLPSAFRRATISSARSASSLTVMTVSRHCSDIRILPEFCPRLRLRRRFSSSS